MKKIIIEVNNGCIDIVSEIPPGIELVIKDYDVIEESEKKDSKGNYEESSYTSADNYLLSKKRV